MANLISKLTVTQLERAIAIRQQIERLEAELDALASGTVAERPIRRRLSVKAQTGSGYLPEKKKRTMSSEARERIAAAQRARWAKARASK